MVLQSRANSGTTYLVVLWLCMVVAPASITQAQAHGSAALSLQQKTGTQECSQEKGVLQGAESLLPLPRV